MDMARHQVPQGLTVRRDSHRPQPARMIKTRILLEEAGIADNGRNIVDRQWHRVAGISVCREVGELTVDPEADFAGEEEEAWRRR
jgi:hypothetical protein